MTFDEALSWVYAQARGLKREDMTFMKEVMSFFSNPQDSLKIIHVAGTNGKGSTIAFLDSLLHHHGAKVARFTSPHLLSVLERFQFEGANMSEEAFCHYVGLIQKSGYELAQFEIFVVIFLLYCRDLQPDYVLLEVGIGGLLDSTNFVDPTLSLITSIGLDHTDLLGKSLSAIAYQKAGIIKEKRPVLVGQVPQEAHAVIQAVAGQKEAPLTFVTGQGVDGQAHALLFEGQVFNLSLKGAYQIGNASLALAAARVLLKEAFDWNKAKEALERTQWAGRFEQVWTQPPIFVDGAHNPQGIDALLATIQEELPKQTIILFGALSKKDYPRMVEQLSQDYQVYLTQFDHPQSASLEDLSKGRRAQVVSNWQTFVHRYQAEGKSPLVITGSLYFIAQVLAYFHT